MFVRTERLTLRPGWIEDAPEMAAAIGHESVVRNLARSPWPYTLSDAQAAIERGFAGQPGPGFLIFAHDVGYRLVGGIGIGPFGEEPHELGYWLTPAAWGRGYATEAAQAVLALAETLGIRRVTAGHFIDNPASGAVLRRLGFVSTGAVVATFSAGRGCATDSVEYVRDRRALAGEAPLTFDVLDAPPAVVAPTANPLERLAITDG
ncbi:GNAT family N-acetyltransferase [Sphingomonas sp. CFBP 13720]|uniref:GNAT family N-acetyltransferase n=1 Tax=Sphingomonas sp. CFBP 13720 TaxID=2775302 RepID=UPI0017838690|nr:GNAT family N-acetyltransferase [Sphingomonas sp. CFBP 13720]MBD8677441.1 GNAT family N-acetyltransferase [Sphingomonas sp. CFBP 13720]